MNKIVYATIHYTKLNKIIKIIGLDKMLVWNINQN